MKEKFLCDECRKFTFGGAAMTGYTCSICGKSSIWGSTNIPEICQECAEKNNKCYKCGCNLT